MSKYLDIIIDWFKWPAAILISLSIPAFVQSYDYFNFKDIKFLVLGVGFIFFYAARIMGNNMIKVTMQILAHEMTHAFFALITFHKVKGIKIADDISGGNMSFSGRGNWLIVIAPYFFPLMAFIYILAATTYTYFFELNKIVSLTMNGFMGYFIAYHCDTVLSQVHSKQTDFVIVGNPFCLFFIPGANLWSVGSMLAYNSRGWEGILAYNHLIWNLNVKNFYLVLNFFLK